MIGDLHKAIIDQKARWRSEGEKSKIPWKYFICELIDNSLEYQQQNKDLIIEIFWNEDHLWVKDNGEGIKEEIWDSAITRYSENLKDTKSEYNVGMKDAIQFFGYQGQIFSSSFNKNNKIFKKALCVNAHYSKDDSDTTWKDYSGIIKFREIEHSKIKGITSDFETTGTLIRIFDFYDERKDKDKIFKIDNFQLFCYFVAIRYYKNFLTNKAIKIKINIFENTETIDYEWIIEKKIPRDFFVIQNLDIFCKIGDEEDWETILKRKFEYLNNVGWIKTSFVETFESFLEWKDNTTFNNIRQIDGRKYDLNLMWKKLLSLPSEKGEELKWAFNWISDLDGFLNEEDSFKIIFGIPHSSSKRKTIEIKNSNSLGKKNLGIRLYQHDRGPHVMEKSIPQKSWIKNLVGKRGGSGVVKLEHFDLEIILPINDKIRTEKNKINFDKELIKRIKDCFYKEVFKKMKLYYVVLFANAYLTKWNDNFSNDDGSKVFFNDSKIKWSLSEMNEVPRINITPKEWLFSMADEDEEKSILLSVKFIDETLPTLTIQNFDEPNKFVQTFYEENPGTFSQEQRDELNKNFKDIVGDRQVKLYRFNAHKNITFDEINEDQTENRKEKLYNASVLAFIIVLLFEGKRVKNEEEWKNWINENIK